MEMLDGADVVRVLVVEAAWARPEVAGAGPKAEAELGVGDFWELGDGSDWEDWSMGDWVAGIGVDTGEAEAVAGAGGEAEDVEGVAGAGGEPDDASGPQEGGRAGGADEPVPWWVVVDSGTMEAVGGAVRLDEALQTFAASVGVGGAEGGGSWQQSWGHGRPCLVRLVERGQTPDGWSRLFVWCRRPERGRARCPK